MMIKMKKDTKRYDRKGSDADKGTILKYISIYLVVAAIATAIGFLLDKTVISSAGRLISPVMDYIFVTITALGEIYIFIFIIAILTVALIVYKRPISSFLLSMGTAFLMQGILKAIISRPRPFEAGLTIAGIASNFSSFPSGHTLMFFAMIPVIGKKFPGLNLSLWALAILVGFSRIYLGVHYLSDVIAGAFLGYGIGWTFMKLEQRYGWNI